MFKATHGPEHSDAKGSFALGHYLTIGVTLLVGVPLFYNKCLLLCQTDLSPRRVEVNIDDIPYKAQKALQNRTQTVKAGGREEGVHCLIASCWGFI